MPRLQRIAPLARAAEKLLIGLLGAGAFAVTTVFAQDHPVDNFMDFVHVGDPGNPDEDGFFPFAESGAGGDQDLENRGLGYVSQEFEMGLTEVTNEMYVRFLNAVASSDATLGLYSTKMGLESAGGIVRLVRDGSYRYVLKNTSFALKPVNFVSSFDAMRFCNWLHNRMPGDGAAANAQLNAGSVASVAVTAAGQGYRPAPKVAFLGTSATGATATAAVSGGKVVSINVTAGGIGYTAPPKVVITGGNGLGATATATVDPSGFIASINITSSGDGYTSAPSITVLSAAEATAVVDSGGRVTGVSVTYGGSGYTSPPAVEFRSRNTQNADTTETGAYELLNKNPDDVVRRERNADYFLPDIDEWHKAAYFDPQPNEPPPPPGQDYRPEPSYWPFADRSTTAPGGNFTWTTLTPAAPANVSNSSKRSFYGTYDQDGNLAEWADSLLTGATRAIAGGDENGVVSQRKYAAAATSNLLEKATLGFRVAKRVEPLRDREEKPIMVKVEDPGNDADDTELLGAVATPFQMGIQEVTNEKYAKFLNDVSYLNDVYNLYDDRMAIDRSVGADGSFSYAPKQGAANKPVVYVDLWCAMRYCNWLHNGGFKDADTESGAYRLLGNVGPNVENVIRNTGALYFLPTKDEWFKAAFYNPANRSYTRFATRSDTANPAEINFNSGGAKDVDELTSPSFYNTYAQSGNVAEWTETITLQGGPDSSPPTASERMIRGGSYANSAPDVSASSSREEFSFFRSPQVGFRVAAALDAETFSDDEDNDGMPDSWERYWGQRAASPTADLDPAGDLDADDLVNLQEFLRGTRPTGTNSADTDGDSMKDGWEVRYDLDPRVASDGPLDPDSDTLTNAQEFAAGTSPRNPDTDGDKMRDDWEVRYNLNANLDDSQQDSDSDGLANLREFRIGTNPRIVDTDNDGLADGAEVDTYSTAPLNKDTDNDSLLDGAELSASPPTDPLLFDTTSSAPSLVEVGQQGNLGDSAHGNRGSVAYRYRLGTYEVTNEEYARFLAAVASQSDNRGLYDSRMGANEDDPSDPWPNTKVAGGIDQTLSGGKFVYTAETGYGRRPVNFVSYDSALRYCNWLHNGGKADSDTESGAYDMADPQRKRSESARFWLPSEDEWYKAAAYGLSPGPRYWLYAYASNTADANKLVITPILGLGNVDSRDFARSYFNTRGQSANAAEWTEAIDPSKPFALGGSILSESEGQYPNVGSNVTTRSRFQPLGGARGRYDIGFRIASIVPVKITVPATFSGRYPGFAATDQIDGIPAAVDYLLGGTATTPPAPDHYPSHWIDGGKMRYSFAVRTDDSSLDYQVQTSTNVAGPWTTNGVSLFQQTTLSSELTRRTFEIPITGEKQRFFRLVVEP
jgi:formylglycine-generating enzyme required for sulfatase activity